MRIFFHIRDGETLIEDPDGQEFASVEAARREAIEAARELMASDLRRGRPIDGRAFEIRDEAGQLIEHLPFKQAIPDAVADGSR